MSEEAANGNNCDDEVQRLPISKLYNPPMGVKSNAHVKTMAEYKKMYDESIENPDKFWKEYAAKFYFQTEHQGEIFDYNFDINNGPIYIKCMEDARTNICYNCLDVHVNNGDGDVVAFYWEGNDPMDCTSITYKQLLEQVNKFSNVLKSMNVKKGDRVAIYMPMILELVVAMLACARIGAMHSIVFGGFSAQSLSSRILDAKCDVLVTADGGFRGTKVVDLKKIADEALELCRKQEHHVSHCIVVKHITGNSYSGDCTTRPGGRPCKSVKVTFNDTVDKWWHELMVDTVSCECDVVWMNSEDPLFMLYTSGSTGKPKGVVHHVTGYMLWASATHHYTFDYHPGDVYFCTADIGWITGHTYITYGPLLNRATSVMFEGLPTFPNPSRYWSIVDKYQVSKFYTAPTAIRSLMKHGDEHVKKYKRDSLRVLGTVGEPINAEAWVWYHNVVGNKNCSIVDTFWQTETGGHVLTPLPGCTPLKPGSATFPFFGVVPAVLNDDGAEIEGRGEGYLVFKKPWPGIMRTIYEDHSRFEQVYFSRFPGYYVPGDGCLRDEEGYHWITGRIDDMMNVSGHLLSTAEVESALTEHPCVSEAAVVSKLHKLKGESVYCFVTVLDNVETNDELTKQLISQVRKRIGAFASPDTINFTTRLPKTRSGKIMRRVLRKVANDETDFGDVSTLADPSVLEFLTAQRS